MRAAEMRPASLKSESGRLPAFDHLLNLPTRPCHRRQRHEPACRCVVALSRAFELLGRERAAHDDESQRLLGGDVTSRRERG